MLEALRVAAAGAMLAYGSLRDLEERRVPNATWYPFAALALALDGWDLGEAGFRTGYLLLTAPAIYAALHLRFGRDDWDTFFERLPSWFPVPLQVLAVALPAAGLAGEGFLRGVSASLLAAVLFVSGAYWLGRLMGRRLLGGADLKALLVLAALLPAFPEWTAEPGLLGLPVVTVLTNGLLLGVAYPLALFSLNMARRDVAVPQMFLGTPVALRDVEPGEPVLETNRGRGIGSVEATGEMLREMEARGLEEVWVAYLIPFVVLLFAGFLMAVTYGDLYFGILRSLL